MRKKLTEIEFSKTVDNYDLLIIGSPVWADGITPAIRTYIHQNNLSTKKIACFVTLKGNNPEKALDSMEEAILPNISLAKLGIIDDLKNPEKVEKQIIDWCKQIRSL
jgi:flavodoxin